MSKAKYLSVDHPELFEFHDSVLKLDYADEKEIAVFVSGLNISKDAEQNPKGYDLEIKNAHIRFCGISEFSYDPGRTWKTDDLGNSVPIGPEIVYHGEEALNRFKEDLKVGAEIFSHTIFDGDHYELQGWGDEPYFFVSFKAAKIEIEWDEYRRPAWYESRKLFERKMLLNTPNGEVYSTASFILIYDPDELFNFDDINEAEPKEIEIGLEYGDKEYWGHGTDRSGQDALADLQKQLPDVVILNGFILN